jgi:hypothetical protein
MRERRHVEAQDAVASRAAHQRLVRAKRAWAQLDDTAKFELVCELVDTRSDELTRAYTGVLAVAAGHARYRRRNARRKSVDREPAVTFLVERKWPAKRKVPRAGDVPARLWAYAYVGGRRELCAVPTDVEDARHYRLRAQARAHVLVTPPAAMVGINRGRGAVTCVIRTSADSPDAYMMSCRHVFGLTASTAAHPLQAEVARDDGGTPSPPVLARVGDIYGPLSSTSRHNFDVALARLEVGERSDALSAVLDRLSPVDGLPYVDGHTAISQLDEYVILAPTGDKRAKYVRGWPATGQPPVDYDRLGLLRQGVLVIESSVLDASPRAGDSGAPVVTRDRTRLVGMHFAGVNETSYMIPAYELVKRSNYVGFGDGEPFVIG